MPLGDINIDVLYISDTAKQFRMKRSETITTAANPNAGTLLAPGPTQLTTTPEMAPRQTPRILYYRGFNSDGQVLTRRAVQLARSGATAGTVPTTITVFDESSASPTQLTLTFRKGEGFRFFGVYATDDTGLTDGDSPG